MVSFWSFDRFSVIFSLAFLVILGIIVVTVVQGISQWNQNNHAPRLTVSATIVAKRADVSRHHYKTPGEAGYHASTTTSYYATFQVDSGDRMELPVSGQQYGLLMEGDRGQLTFQGTRFLDFQRD